MVHINICRLLPYVGCEILCGAKFSELSYLRFVFPCCFNMCGFSSVCSKILMICSPYSTFSHINFNRYIKKNLCLLYGNSLTNNFDQNYKFDESSLLPKRKFVKFLPKLFYLNPTEVSVKTIL